MPESDISKYVQTALDNGNMYPELLSSFASNAAFATAQQQSVKMLFEGASVDEAIAWMDEQIQTLRDEPLELVVYEKLADAEEDFTLLETSYYLADKLREVSGAQIALMPNKAYFRGNLAKFHKGEISSDLRLFVLKGVGADDRLTVYKVSGAQLKTLLEHPISNNVEIDAMMAASGLKQEYAPWHQRGSRLLKVTLDDGSEIVDDQIYTVAAFTSVLPENYYTEEVEVLTDLGQLQDILASCLKADGSIKPDIRDRVRLFWDVN